jgi:hypothetical protein
MKEKMFRSFVQSKSRDEHMKEVMPVHCMVAPEQVKPSRRRGGKQRRIMIVYHSASRGRRGV